jgi:hypothetical protein
METSFELSNNVVGVIFEEKLDNEKLKEIRKLVEERIEQYTWVSLYLEDRFNQGATLKAILEDLFYECSKTEPLLKVAVVTDKKRFRLVARVKDILLASNVQSFDRKDRTQAINWLME